MQFNKKEMLARLIEVAGKPATWVGRCHEMAALLNTVMDLRLYLTYGAYHGRVSEKSPLYRHGCGIYRHGWLETFEEKPTIVDPTRWVFENRTPSVYVGPNIMVEADCWMYDVGNDAVRKMLEEHDSRTSYMGTDCRKCPLRTDNEEIKEFVLRHFGCLPEDMNLIQVGRLANLSRATLGDLIRPIYELLVFEDKTAFIPVDNYGYVILRQLEIERRKRGNS